MRRPVTSAPHEGQMPCTTCFPTHHRKPIIANTGTIVTIANRKRNESNRIPMRPVSTNHTRPPQTTTCPVGLWKKRPVLLSSSAIWAINFSLLSSLLFPKVQVNGVLTLLRCVFRDDESSPGRATSGGTKLLYLLAGEQIC